MDIINPPSPPQVSTTIGGSVIQFADYDIGPWNMDTTISVDVPHSLTDISKILEIYVSIVNDLVTTAMPIYVTDGVNEHPAGSFYADTTNIHLIRRTGGFFDDASYDDAVMSRGKILVKYIP